MKLTDLYKVLLEMPSPLGKNIAHPDSQNEINNPTDFNTVTEKQLTTAYKDRAKKFDIFIDNGSELNIYWINTLGKYYELYAFHLGKCIATIMPQMTDDDGIRLEYVETNKEFKRSFSILAQIYSNFILKYFKYIESDKIMSGKGFNFWIRNFDYFIEKGYQIELWKYNRYKKSFIKTLEHADELRDYYIDSRTFSYVFVLTSK